MEGKLRDRVPVLVLLMIAIVALFVPLLIVVQGYTPSDDMLRHVGYATVDKTWHDYVAFRDGIYAEMDTHPGWHFYLKGFHGLFGMDPDGLILVSILSLFALLFVPACLLLKRPEAFLIAFLLVTMVDSTLLLRTTMGRPFILQMLCVLTFLLYWNFYRKACLSWKSLAPFFVLSVIQTWAHSTWYLLALPIAAFGIHSYIEREYKKTIAATAAILAGIIGGAILTGHPIDYLIWNVKLVIWCLEPAPDATIVSELQAMSLSSTLVLFFIGYLVLRPVILPQGRESLSHPAAIMALMCWLMGFFVSRFWSDWGIIAALSFVTLDVQQWLKTKTDERGFDRLVITGFFAAVMIVGFTMAPPFKKIWQTDRLAKYRKLELNPTFQEMAAGADGTVYNTDIFAFYHFVYSRPDADWQFALGFGPALMRDDLRGVYYDYAETKLFESLDPWFQALKPNDLILLSNVDVRNADPSKYYRGLEWLKEGDIWVGRLKPTEPNELK